MDPSRDAATVSAIFPGKGEELTPGFEEFSGSGEKRDWNREIVFPPVAALV